MTNEFFGNGLDLVVFACFPWEGTCNGGGQIRRNEEMGGIAWCEIHKGSKKDFFKRHSKKIASTWRNSFANIMVAANMDSLDPESLILPLKKNHHIMTFKFPYHLSSARRIILMLQTNWLLVSSTPDRFFGLKAVNTMRPVTVRAVQRSMWSTEPRSLDKRFWLETHGNVFLVVKTGIKICGNRLAPHLSGMQTVSMATWSYKQNSYKT